jgi:hypothetical protein
MKTINAHFPMQYMKTINAHFPMQYMKTINAHPQEDVKGMNSTETGTTVKTDKSANYLYGALHTPIPVKTFASSADFWVVRASA